jgi:tripartite-type tricarboxylate transporter receptor subunit TctC
VTNNKLAAGWSRRRWLVSAGASVGATAGVLAAGAAFAQAYPDKPVRIIVPYSAGGSLDIAMRIIAQQLTVQTGKQFVVENRTGASGTIGVAAAVEAPADGYTLLSAGANLTTTPYMSKVFKFDPLTSFTYIARLVLDASTLAVPAASPYRTLAEFVTYAKANPGKLSHGSSGNGTPGHIAMELFKRRAGIDVKHIPYRGGGAVLNDAVGGQIDSVMIGTSVLAPQIRSGRLRGLGTSTPQRFFTLPDVPAIAETYPGYEASTWIGLSARAGLPRPVVQYLEQQVQVALARPDVQARFRDAGLQPAFQTSEEFTRFAIHDAEVNKKLIEEAGITAD